MAARRGKFAVTGPQPAQPGPYRAAPPASSEAAPNHTEPNSSDLAETTGAAGQAILLIDDDIDILPEYQELLELEGFRALVSSDPSSAVQIVNQCPQLRLIITDLHMEQMDGVSLIRALRKTIPAGRDLAFILLTGDADAHRVPDLGAVPILLKPINLEHLVAAVRSALGHPGDRQ